MKKIVLLISLLCTIVIANLYGQLLPCCTSSGFPSECQEEPGTNVNNSCIICSPAGVYSGNNRDYPATGGWVSIIANASGNIDAIVLISNCIIGDGLELSLWDDAGNEIVVFSGNSPTSSVSQSNLIPGEIYHIQIKDFGGDICDYTLVINGPNGSMLGVPDPTNDIRIVPDIDLCVGMEVCFEIDPIIGVVYYKWEAPSNMTIVSGGGESDLSVCCRIDAVGGTVLRLTASNYCFNGFPILFPVVVNPIPPTFLSPIYVCPEKLPFDTVVCGQTIRIDSGSVQSINCKTQFGCDSIINLNFVPKNQIPHIIDTVICTDDCVMVGDSCYSEDGHHIISLSGAFSHQNGCDSSVHLIIKKKVASSPELEAMIVSSIWKIGEMGSIVVTATEGTPPYTYNWSNGNTGSFGNDLLPGEYCITVTDQNGCTDFECYQINHGFEVAPIHLICAGEKANLAVSPSTGATFSWSPSVRLSCIDCPNPIANPNKTTVYTVTATLPDGRSGSQNVVVIVLPNIFCNGKPIDINEDHLRIISNFDFQKITEKNLVEMETQITNLFLPKELKIAPNPTNEKATILTPEKVESVHVFDFGGKQVMTVFEKEIDLSKLSKGIYFIKIKLYNQLIVRRVILI